MCYCPSSDGGALISVALCMSPCSSDFIIDLLRHRRSSGVKSLRISHQLDATFPADCPHLTNFHCRRVHGEYRRIHRVSQHIARFVFETTAVQAIVTAAVYRGFGSVLCPLRS